MDMSNKLNENKMKATFEIGKTYVMTFIGDSDLKVKFKCIKRTASFATFEGFKGEILRRKINLYSDSEYVLEGNYSMAPSIYADSVINEQTAL